MSIEQAKANLDQARKNIDVLDDLLKKSRAMLEFANARLDSVTDEEKREDFLRICDDIRACISYFEDYAEVVVQSEMACCNDLALHQIMAERGNATLH
jgi:hypothetical protein